jgi:hypothetical protein
MRYKNNFSITLCFFLFGILSLFSHYGIAKISLAESVGIVFLVYGIATVYKSFGTNQKGTLSIAAIVFLTGIVLLIKSRFDLLDTRGVVFTSILFIGGATFLILFFDNTAEKVFLYAGLCLIISSIITVIFLKSWGIFYLINKIGNYFEYFWPVILIILGISLFNNRRS